MIIKLTFNNEINSSLQIGDVRKTHADIRSVSKFSDYLPIFSIDEGIEEFISWYKKYYKVK